MIGHDASSKKILLWLIIYWQKTEKLNMGEEKEIPFIRGREGLKPSLSKHTFMRWCEMVPSHGPSWFGWCLGGGGHMNSFEPLALLSTFPTCFSSWMNSTPRVSEWNGTSPTPTHVVHYTSPHLGGSENVRIISPPPLPLFLFFFFLTYLCSCTNGRVCTLKNFFPRTLICNLPFYYGFLILLYF